MYIYILRASLRSARKPEFLCTKNVLKMSTLYPINAQFPDLVQMFNVIQKWVVRTMRDDDHRMRNYATRFRSSG